MSTLPLAKQVAAVARQQHGLITNAQLAELKLSRKQIQGWTASGRLDRVLPCVHRLAGAPKSREQAFQAAVLWGGPRSVLSHRAAGELWGFGGLTAARAEITIPVEIRKRSALVVVHQTRVQITDRRMRRGVPVTTPERTLIDLAGSLPASQLEIAFESARRERQVTVASVARTAARIGTQGRAGSDELQRLLALLASEPPCESALEVLTARILRTSGLPKPQRRVEIDAAGSTCRLDFAWPDALVALECDGRKWHELDFERDRRRWSAITATTGYRILWATWNRINGQPEQLIAELRSSLRRPASPRDHFDRVIAADAGRPKDLSAFG